MESGGFDMRKVSVFAAAGLLGCVGLFAQGQTTASPKTGWTVDARSVLKPPAGAKVAIVPRSPSLV